MSISEEFYAALTSALEKVSAKNIARTVENLSQRYREGHAQNRRTFLYTQEDITAYAAYRMPATFAALQAALTYTHALLQQWQPKTLLDVCAGPGTALWASVAVWSSIETCTLLERDQHMIRFGQSLASSASAKAIKQAKWIRTDLTTDWESPAHDLVTASYMLGELPTVQHETFIQQLWERTQGLLLLIEPGTPRGFALIRKAREQLLTQGARMIAPCPHNHTCPMPENDWCHFARRLNRTRLQRDTKGGKLSYEDEKFSYIAVARIPATHSMNGRVIRHPQKRSGHVHLELCTTNGLRHEVVSRKAGAYYRKAQDAEWGDLMPIHLLEE
jgi:ribosomal protein RSM22 (predicted rRNA methylase)